MFGDGSGDESFIPLVRFDANTEWYGEPEQCGCLGIAPVGCDDDDGDLAMVDHVAKDGDLFCECESEVVARGNGFGFEFDDDDVLSGLE